MSWRVAAAGRRGALARIALGCVLCCLGTIASAQNTYRPVDEIFGGYAFLAPNGWGDLDYKINNIPNAFDASNTYYLRRAPNLGLLIDGSGHFLGGTTPPNLANGSNNSTAAGYLLGGLQYKFHTRSASPFAHSFGGRANLFPNCCGGAQQFNAGTTSVSPFLRAFVGGANLSPDCCGGTQWNFASGGGGGLDLALKPGISIRLAQVDYISSHYNHRFPSNHPTQWNSVRVAAGVVFSLGSYNTLPLSCSVTVLPMPAEVLAGEPIKLSSTGTNFNPKHPANCGWTTSGGKLSSATTQAAEIDTTGMVPGTYSASATITDPKTKKMNSATCSASFIVKQPPPPLPPVVSCSVIPSTVAIGEPATITMTASSPDRRPLNYTWSATGGQLSEKGTSAILTASNADAGKTITVTGTATDDRSLSSNCTGDVKVAPIEPCVKIEDWGECTFEKDPKRPWRVDNDCKDVLDKLAIRLQQMPNGKLAIVGYTDEKEVINEQTLGAQRSVNVKYYLTTDGPTKNDSGRIQPQQGGTKGKATHFYFMPEGKLCRGQVELGTTVDETKMQGQSRNSPARGKKPAKAKPPAAPSQ